VSTFNDSLNCFNDADEADNPVVGVKDIVHDFIELFGEVKVAETQEIDHRGKSKKKPNHNEVYLTVESAADDVCAGGCCQFQSNGCSHETKHINFE